jgi:DNA-directed RNA polymerase subunit M/transcription elongation factor TFIIS
MASETCSWCGKMGLSNDLSLCTLCALLQEELRAKLSAHIWDEPSVGAPVTSAIVCPKCKSSAKMMHVWRTDMSSLTIIDEYRCGACKHRWTESNQVVSR